MHKKLIVYLTTGYPDLSTTKDLVYLLESSGVDIIELGVPFSDPIADGQSIQFSSYIALKNGITIKSVLELVDKIRRRSDIPIYIMSYVNPIYQYGTLQFARECRELKIRGAIIPDITYDSSDDIKDDFLSHNLNLVYMVSPNTPENRIEKIFNASRGFVYVVSVLGVTGARERLSSDIFSFLKKLQKFDAIDKYIGFGISSAEQIKKIKRYINGVIIGSAIVDILRCNERKDAFLKIQKLIRSCKEELLKET